MKILFRDFGLGRKEGKNVPVKGSRPPWSLRAYVGQSCSLATGQLSHFGYCGRHISWPNAINRIVTCSRISEDINCSRSLRVFSGTFPSDQPKRRATRWTCVSTTMPASFPKVTDSTKLATFAPTPGRAVSSSKVAGTRPACLVSKSAAICPSLFAFVLK